MVLIGFSPTTAALILEVGAALASRAGAAPFDEVVTDRDGGMNILGCGRAGSEPCPDKPASNFVFGDCGANAGAADRAGDGSAFRAVWTGGVNAFGCGLAGSGSCARGFRSSAAATIRASPGCNCGVSVRLATCGPGTNGLSGTRGAGICSSGLAFSGTGSAGPASSTGCSVGRGGSGSGGMYSLGGGGGSGASNAIRLGAFRSCSTFNSGPGARINCLAGLGREDFATIVWVGCFSVACGGSGRAAALGEWRPPATSRRTGTRPASFSCGAISAAICRTPAYAAAG